MQHLPDDGFPAENTILDATPISIFAEATHNYVRVFEIALNTQLCLPMQRYTKFRCTATFFFQHVFFSKNQKFFFKVLRSGPYFQGSSVSTRQAQGHLNRAKISNRSKVMAILLSHYLNMFFFREIGRKKTLYDSNLVITFERLEIFARFRCPCACLGETELP